MKLVLCIECGDIFNLRMNEKKCSCGSVAGRYVDNESAVVRGPHIALAIGNGSFYTAVAARSTAHDWRNSPDSERVMGLFRQIRELAPSCFIAWARGNEGPSNPHSTWVQEQTTKQKEA